MAQVFFKQKSNVHLPLSVGVHCCLVEMLQRLHVVQQLSRHLRAAWEQEGCSCPNPNPNRTRGLQLLGGAGKWCDGACLPVRIRHGNTAPTTKGCSLSLSLSLYIYIYIHTHTFVLMCVVCGVCVCVCVCVCLLCVLCVCGCWERVCVSLSRVSRSGSPCFHQKELAGARALPRVREVVATNPKTCLRRPVV